MVGEVGEIREMKKLTIWKLIIVLLMISFMSISASAWGIKICKHTDQESVEEFNFSANWGTFSLENRGCIFYSGSSSGEYYVQEDEKDYWELYEIACSNNDKVSIYLEDQKINFTFNEGEEIVIECYFKNRLKDSDNDGLPDIRECSPPDPMLCIGTDPNDPDTDGDGISDGDGKHLEAICKSIIHLI